MSVWIEIEPEVSLLLTEKWKIMAAKSQFKIEYTWNRKEIFEKAKSNLLKEGWKIIDETLPAYPEKENVNETYTCWFQREWK